MSNEGDPGTISKTTEARASKRSVLRGSSTAAVIETPDFHATREDKSK